MSKRRQTSTFRPSRLASRLRSWRAHCWCWMAKLDHAVQLEELSPQEVGRLGERLAANFLEQKGWLILARNYVGPRRGEVDLVCRGGDSLRELVFVEVKTRTSERFGRPLDAVDQDKQKLIKRGAYAWMHLLKQGRTADDYRHDIAWRFDVVEVIFKEGERPRLHLVENAFQ